MIRNCYLNIQSVYQPGKPGIPGKPMEFEITHGKPGKPMEFDSYTWNFMIKLFFESKLCEKVTLIKKKHFLYNVLGWIEKNFF